VNAELSADEFLFLLSEIGVDEEAEGKLPLDRVAAARCLARASLSESQLSQLAQVIANVDSLSLGVLLAVFERSLETETALQLSVSLNKNPAAKKLRRRDFTKMLEKSDEAASKHLASFVATLKPVTNDVHLTQLLRVMPAGDVERGREIFFGRNASCASCHTVVDKGGKVGPDLTKIGAIRNRRDLLEAITYPSASFARGYRTFTVVTDRGRVFSGLIVKESTTSITLMKSDLSEIRISRSAIEQMTESDTSIMPNGLDSRLHPRDLADLLQFLESLK
jgi:putative heme-binding domain-containing protein